MIKLFTIGFTKKTAQQFFDLLKKNKVEKIVDTRISNTSQLAGFAKGNDLNYFLKEIINVGYEHDVDLAPTMDMMRKYRKKELSWEEYEMEYLNLIDRRKINKKINIEELHQHCLLCSEHGPEKCHRRLLAEYFAHINNDVEIIHLMG